jgi:hypothetical protein
MYVQGMMKVNKQTELVPRGCVTGSGADSLPFYYRVSVFHVPLHNSTSVTPLSLILAYYSMDENIVVLASSAIPSTLFFGLLRDGLSLPQV